MTSLLLVFGTMVEFSAVLMAKQRDEWKKKATEKDNKEHTSKNKQAWTNSNDKSATEYFRKIKDPDDVTGVQILDQFSIIDQILNNFAFDKNMPPYRKVDIIAFFFFTGFYLCFNLIYFYLCTNF